MKAVNLIPSDSRGGGSGSVTGKSEGAAFLVLGLLGGLAVLALLYGVARHQVSSRRGEAATLSAEAAQAQARANQLAPYTSFVAMRDARMTAISQLVDSRFDWAHAIQELGRVLPYNVSLSSVNGTIGAGTGASGASTVAATTPSPTAAGGAGGSVSSATPPGSTPILTLAGCAISQSEVAQMLQRLRLIDGVSDVTLQSSTKSDSGSAGGGGSSSGGCPPHAPVFSAQVTFAALPAAGAASAGATPAGSPAAASPAAGASTTPVAESSSATTTGGKP